MAADIEQEKEDVWQMGHSQHRSSLREGRLWTYSDYSPMTSQGRFVVFRSMKDWEEVDSTLDRLGSSITTFQVVAAFKCLSGMGGLPEEATCILTKLSGIAIALSDRMLPEHHAKIVLSCGKMQYWNSTMLNTFAKTLLKFRLHGRMPTASAVSIIQGLGKLHTLSTHTHSQELKSGENVFLFKRFDLFMEKLGNQIAKKHMLSAFSPQQLVLLIEGFAKMRRSEPVGEWLWLIEVIKAVLHPAYVEKYTEREMITILSSLRYLGISCHETPVWFARELIHEDRMDDYTEGDLATILYNLGVMEFYDVENMGYALMAEIAQQHRLHKFSNSQLLTALQGCAMLCYCEEIPFTALAQEIVNPERVPNFSASDIVTILESFRVLDFKDKETLSSLWKTLFNEGAFRRKTVLRQRPYHPGLSDAYTRGIMNRFGKLGFAEWNAKNWHDAEPAQVSKSGFESPAPEFQLTDWTWDEEAHVWIPPLFRSRTAFRAGIGWKPLKEGRRVPLGRNTLKRKRQRQQVFRHQQEARDLKKKLREERLRKTAFHDERRAALRAQKEISKKQRCKRTDNTSTGSTAFEES